MMVWQDMINGGKEGWNWRSWLSIIIRATYSRDDTTKKHLKLVGRTDPALRDEFQQEFQEMIDSLYNSPCIAVWVPFNEGWGQFSAVEVGNWVMQYDPTRLVDTTSGFNLHGPTDIRSWHIYMRKLKMVEKKLNPNWVLAFSEVGGYGLRVPHHLWDETDRSRFYGNAKSSEGLLRKYQNLILDQLPALAEQGISALIYTQTTDVETEVNGLMTYDRKEKIPATLIHKINTEFLGLFDDYTGG
jgi:beta-galactosidase/beta-glucuronidase